MRKITALFVGIAALGVISTVAEAADGCGSGMYYNGRRCVPKGDFGYRPYHRPHHGMSLDLGRGLRLHLGGRDERRYSAPGPRFKTWNHWR
jgi:hypothetical protein